MRYDAMVPHENGDRDILFTMCHYISPLPQTPAFMGVEISRRHTTRTSLQALLEKSLFLTNAAGLEELDDDSGDGGGKGDEGTGAGDWSDDDDGGGHGGGIRGASDAGGAGASELEVR